MFNKMCQHSTPKGSKVNFTPTSALYKSDALQLKEKSMIIIISTLAVNSWSNKNMANLIQRMVIDVRVLLNAALTHTERVLW